MSLDIREREREGIVFLELDGRLVAGDESALFRQKIQALAAAGKPNAVVNMAGVDYIDSTGLGALVMSFTSMRKAGGALKLLHLTRRNIELLVLTKLETVFEVFTDEQDALNSFFPDRELKRFDILKFVKESAE